MKRAIAFLGLLIMCASSSFAGTAADPDVTDPVGDAPAIRTAGANDPSADIRSMWIERVYSGSTLTGFAVNVEMGGPAKDDTVVQVNWSVGDDCFGWLSLASHNEPMTAGPGSIESWSDEAVLDYYCSEDEGVTELLDLVTIRIGGRDVRAGLTINGNVWTARVPLSVFTEGASASLYGAGTKLTGLTVYSQEEVGLALMTIDGAPRCGNSMWWESCGTSRDVTL